MTHRRIRYLCAGVLVLTSCVQRRPTTQPVCPEPVVCPPVIVCDDCPEPVVCPQCPELVVCDDPEPCPDCPGCPDPEASTGPYEADYVLEPGVPLEIPGNPFDAVGHNTWKKKGVNLGVWKVSTVTVTRTDGQPIVFNDGMPHYDRFAGHTVNYRWKAHIAIVSPVWRGMIDRSNIGLHVPKVVIDVRALKVIRVLLMDEGPFTFLGSN